MSSRGRGGKFGKPQRGGGKKFSRNLRPLEDDNSFDIPQNPEAEASDGAESSEDEDGLNGANEGNVTLSREERRAAARARKEQARKAKGAAPGSDEEGSDEEEETPNPKAIIPPAKFAPGNPNSEGNTGSGGMSRREREAVEAAAAKERYMKMHAAGKTDEAKADLARLALIRKEREEKAKQRKAELEEKKAAAEAKVAERKK